MIARELVAKGYRLVPVNPFEVGLLCGEKPIRTWWAGAFGQTTPSLDEPQVLEAIELFERHQLETCPECGRLTGNNYVCSSCLKVSVL